MDVSWGEPLTCAGCRLMRADCKYVNGWGNLVTSNDNFREIVQAIEDERYSDVLEALDCAKERGEYTGNEAYLSDAHVKALLNLGRVDEAAKVLAGVLEGVAEDEVPPVLLVDQAVVAFRQGRYQDVVAAFDRAHKRGAHTGSDPELCDMHVKALLASGRLDDAAKLLAGALEGVAEDEVPPVLLVDQAVVMFRQGDLNRALEALDRAKRPGLDPVAEWPECELRVEILIGLDKLSEATRALRNFGVHALGTSRWVRLQEARLPGDQSQIDASLQVAVEIADAAPSDNEGPLDLLAIASARMALNRFDDAAGPLREARMQAPNLASFPYYLMSYCQDLWIKILLGGFRLGVLAGPFDKLAVDEGGSGTDQGDQVRCIDGPPAVLR